MPDQVYTGPYLDIDKDLLAVYHCILELTLNNEKFRRAQVQNFSFNLKVFNSTVIEQTN